MIECTASIFVYGAIALYTGREWLKASQGGFLRRGMLEISTTYLLTPITVGAALVVLVLVWQLIKSVRQIVTGVDEVRVAAPLPRSASRAMDETAILSLAVSLGILAVLFMAGVQIGVVLAVAGIVGSTIFTGNIGVGLNLLSLQSLDVTSNYSLLVIPLFIALGSLAASSGITTDLFSAYYKWFGRIAGGIAIATIVTCASMAAITGSSVAVAAAMCRIALPELRRYNYSEALSLGAICVGGTVAIMIPPSITLVLFAIFAEESVGKLLIAGVMPGLLTAFLYCVLILVACWIKPSLGPPGPAFSRAEKIASIRLVLPFAIVVLSVVLGMLSGIWTPVEAAAIGVMLVMAIGFLRRSQSLRDVAVAFRTSAMTSASVMIVVIGSLVYSNFLALNGFQRGGGRRDHWAETSAVPPLSPAGVHLSGSRMPHGGDEHPRADGAADHPGGENRRLESDMVWRRRRLHDGSRCRDAAGRPEPLRREGRRIRRFDRHHRGRIASILAHEHPRGLHSVFLPRDRAVAAQPDVRSVE